MPQIPGGSQGQGVQELAAPGFGWEFLAQCLHVPGVLEGSVGPLFGELHWGSGHSLVGEESLGRVPPFVSPQTC